MGERKNYDVIVIGAGISGLACARSLIEAGQKVLVLEGRDHVGGRVHTVYDPHLQSPIELGAEFIHGAHPSLLAPLEAIGSFYQDVLDSRFYYENSKLVKKPHYWDSLEKIVDQLKAYKKADISVQRFCDITKANRKNLALFKSYVEGFHAGDLNLISAKALVAAEQDDEKEINKNSQFRPAHGYAPLLKYFVPTLARTQSLMLNTVVKKVTWRKNAVTVLARSSLNTNENIFYAKKLVITVPMGVLKAPATTLAGIEWNPYPKHLADITGAVEMGDIQKIILKFKTRFWEDLTEKPLGFIQMPPETCFPTWWTLMPNRLPFLIAWQGGKKAQEMALMSEEQRVKMALQTLSQWTKKSIDFLSNQLQSIHSHNWTLDPFSLGAYSYTLVDGADKAKNFQRPVAQTLYFTGEASVAGSSRGTVNGALAAGHRTAAQILKSSI